MPFPVELTLKGELTPVEAVSVTSAGAIAVAAVYNLGFFSSFGVSTVSLLTIEDLVTGAAVAFIPLLLAVEIAWFVHRAFSRTKGTKWFWVVSGALIIAAIADLYLIIFRNKDPAFVYITPAFSLFMAMFNVVPYFEGKLSWLGVAGLMYFAYNGIFSFGSAYFQAPILSYKTPTYEINTSSGDYLGLVVRITSRYTFFYDGKSVSVFPNDKVNWTKKTEALATNG